MKKKNVFLLALLFSLVSSTFFQPTINAATTNNISIVLDGKLLTFTTVGPQVINDRTLIPFRAIGEAMGASANWDDSQKKVTMLLHDKYVILYIGNNTMTYGNFTTDQEGRLVYSTQNTYQLDAAPAIINSYTMVPLRAVSEGLGADVNWIGEARTAIITSPARSPVPTATPVPTSMPTATPVPTATPTPSAGVFDETNWFSIITGKKAQTLYKDGETFILVYFDSQSKESAEYLPMIKDVAEENSYKVYAVDAYSDNYDKGSLKFIWDFVRPSRITYPTVFFVYDEDDVDYLQQPKKSVLNSYFEDYDSAFEETSWFSVISGKKAETIYQKEEEPFVLVYFDSDDDASAEYLPMIKSLAKQNDFKVYGVDAYDDNYKRGDLKFVWDIVRNSSMKYPAVFFVYDKDNIVYSIQPKKTNLSYQFDEFLDNKIGSTAKPTTTPSSQWKDNATKLTLAELQVKLDMGEEFIYIHYNSSKHTANSINIIRNASNNLGTKVFYTDDINDGINLINRDFYVGSNPSVFYVSGGVVTGDRTNIANNTEAVQALSAVIPAIPAPTAPPLVGPEPIPETETELEPESESKDYWREKTVDQIKTKISDGDTFIYVVYNYNGTTHDELLINYIKDAANELGKKVYITDLKSKSLSSKFPDLNFKGVNEKYPGIFYIKKGEVYGISSEPINSKNKAIEEIKQYLK